MWVRWKEEKEKSKVEKKEGTYHMKKSSKEKGVHDCCI